MTMQSRSEIEARILAQAERDPAFRQWLRQEPKAAVADLLGVTLPAGMSITVLEEQPGQHYLVLPPPPLDALPLDDLELALVGGGRTLRPVPIPSTPPLWRSGDRLDVAGHACLSTVGRGCNLAGRIWFAI